MIVLLALVLFALCLGVLIARGIIPPPKDAHESSRDREMEILVWGRPRLYDWQEEGDL